jgi:hypothetical protein
VIRSIAIVLASALALVASYWGFHFIGNGQPNASAHGGIEAAQPGARPASVGAPADPLPMSPSPGAGTPSGASGVAPAKSEPRFVIDIVIARGAAAPFQTLKVNKGDVVAVSVDSDEAGKLEVHGYRKELEIQPRAKASMTFTADRTGRFPIDLHGKGGAHIEAAALEVLPR